MIGLIEDLIEYEKTGRPSPQLVPAEMLVGRLDLRVISVEIIDWLRLEKKRAGWRKDGKRSDSKPLILSREAPWCQGLKKLIETDNYFAKALSIKGYEVYYGELVDNEEREKATVLATESYHPIVFITPRKN